MTRLIRTENERQYVHCVLELQQFTSTVDLEIFLLQNFRVLNFAVKKKVTVFAEVFSKPHQGQVSESNKHIRPMEETAVKTQEPKQFVSIP